MSTILIVDDIAANRQVLVTLLRPLGHRVLEAANGSEGLAAVGAERPDLVITDVLMPVMDGYDFVRQLRLHPCTSTIPVVFYTAYYGETEARTIAAASGVSDVLTKPIASADVLRVVARLLGESDPPAPSISHSPATEFGPEHLRLLADTLPVHRGDLRTANARLRALINIGLELASERDPDRMFERVCVAARELFGATYVTLGMVDLTDRTVRRVVSWGTDAAEWARVGDTVSGVLATVMAERRTWREDDSGRDRSRPGFPAGHPEVQAFVAAPMLSPTQVYGWICLVGNEGRAFTEDDEHLVNALSAEVGRIYENLSFSAIARERANELEREIRERKEAELALRRTEERMRFALQNANVGIWDIDYTTGVFQWSDTMEAQYGLAPGVFNQTFEGFLERIHPDDRASVVETVGNAMASGADFSILNRTIRPDGTVRWLNGAGRILLGAGGAPMRGVGISQDVTERRILEEQYQQAQKMEALGRLAAGVAHDFNNLLTVILGFCELLLADLDPADKRQPDIAEIQKAGARAAGLTRQLLAFSRREIIQPTVLDLNVIVAEIHVWLGRLIGDNVRIVLRLARQPAAVTADRGQLEQILLNLAVNARDAMPKGGTLTIETGNVDFDKDRAKATLALRSGPYATLTVTDTGSGLTPEARARLFEPFFTTKSVGKGTGLGLATVHGIVMRSGGGILVDTEVGSGTSFTVYFPRADASALVVEAPTPVPRRRAGVQTVLVVDDAEGLRELTKRLLEREGYTVLVASNADEARQLFDQHPSIDVLLTDVLMPGASGPELVMQLMDRWPALRVIYMSAYTDDAIAHHGVLDPGIAFLHKPFSSDKLSRKIREVLER